MSDGNLPVPDRDAAFQRVVKEEKVQGYMAQTWLTDGHDDLSFYFASLESGMAKVDRRDGTVVFRNLWPR